MTYQTEEKPKGASRRRPRVDIEPISGREPRGAVWAHKPELAKIMPIWEVYFVISVTSALVKIGYAKDADARLSSMQVGSPEELRLLGVIETYLPIELEADLHAHFASQRVRGEWFKFSDELFHYVMQHGRRSWDD